MEYSKSELQSFSKRLLMSRRRILAKYGFFGLLMMHLKYSVDDTCETVFTDGIRIGFDPGFLMKLSEDELDEAMLHQLMHIILGHVFTDTDNADDEELDEVVEAFLRDNDLKGDDSGSQKDGDKQGENSKTGKGKQGKNAKNGGDKQGENSKTGRGKQGKNTGNGKDKRGSNTGNSVKDDHSRWGNGPGRSLTKLLWQGRIIQAAMAIEKQIEYGGVNAGQLPGGLRRIVDRLRSHRTDWREMLRDIIQEEICDYGFEPPDRRYEGDFFLPDFNETVEKVRNAVFMVDTSGSMSEEILRLVYSEVYGALEMFEGKLSGWLGFFDSSVEEPRPFDSEAELEKIQPVGGGGTNFIEVFRYLREEWEEEEPSCIIILTDGRAPWPSEDAAGDIPVLWLITGEEDQGSPKPPWGKVGYVK